MVRYICNDTLFIVTRPNVYFSSTYYVQKLHYLLVFLPLQQFPTNIRIYICTYKQPTYVKSLYTMNTAIRALYEQGCPPLEVDNVKAEAARNKLLEVC